VGQYKTRLVVVSVVLAALLLVVVGRLFTIQVVEGKKYVLKSRSQVQQRRPLSAKRGEIFDRKGRQLAASVAGRMALSSDMVGMEAGKQVVLQRVYPMGDVAGSLLGYLGREGYGFGGIEYAYDHYLRGEDGWEMAHREAHDRHGKQRTYSKPGLSRKDPRDGSDVYLTIDLHLQKIVQSVLKQTVKDLQAKGAMAIVMDPHTGKILAMANEPSFNPNVPMMFDSLARQNTCVTRFYEHGSTFKVMTAAVALQEKIFSERDTIDGNNGTFEIYGQQVTDETPQGRITMSRALAVSSNVCFAQVANKFTDSLFYEYARNFGFGTKTGTFPDEQAGILHQVRSRSWSGRTRVSMAYGYDISPTFLQMMTAYASIANGGVLLTPVICEKIAGRDGSAVQSAAVKPVRRVISDETALRLRRMMREVVESGTGRSAAVPGIAVAGKTGTARKPEAGGGYSRTKHWMSFIGFLPVESPTLLCGIVIDEPTAGKATAGATAAPAFSKIMSQAIAHPELEFLKRAAAAVRDSAESRQIRVPNIAGRTRKTAASQLDSMNITYSFVGDGDVIRHQSPAAGSFMANRTGGIVLYTDEREFTADSTARIVPDGVGKDLRDAFNLFNANGIAVYAVGSGIVKRQSIAPGELMTSSAVCTLYGGAKKK